ncbi:putative ankyrin repeat protein RF_0381 [Phymastichus coffea]|uniref:putative ankyrin repeat protein RF_0381 n=1 Tax=Phymastichus coffea TaxID=108790 RepID=UPI00273C3B0A|nr:putative ankyrin repeat protein RF_0381 [Phymastichus coffea]
MAIYETLQKYISDFIDSMYTISITAGEIQLQSNMKSLREALRDDKIDTSTVGRFYLSNCLWFAVLDQDTAAVRKLIKHNPDLNFTRSDINMLWMSIIRRNRDIAKILIEEGADVNVSIATDGPSFLHYLATMDDEKNSLELAKMMIERNADVNAYMGKFSVLETAVIHGAVPFVEELLQHGAHFQESFLVLEAARSSKSSELLPIIVNSIHDPDDQLQLVVGILLHLIEKGDNNVIEIKALLRLDLPILDLDVSGWTILRFAVYYKNIKAVLLLLSHSVEANEKMGEQPLLWPESNVTLNAAHKLVIKHLATLVFNKIDIHESDLDKINDCPRRSAYYQKCLNRLYHKQ